MLEIYKVLFCVILVSFTSQEVCCNIFGNYNVKLKNDGPIVRGGTIQFYVEVYDGNNLSNGDFKYYWEDNAIPQHKYETDQTNSTNTWNITYNKDIYRAGSYVVRVVVSRCFIVCYEVQSVGTEFYITETFNGDIILIQNNTKRDNSFVSNNELTLHEINLKKSDIDVISQAPNVLTYWFVDCIYYGITNDLKFTYNYSDPEKDHNIEALLVADFTPIPITTTTVKPKPTVTSSRTTTTKVTTTTVKPSNVTKKVNKRSQNTNVSVSNIKVNINGSLVPYNVTFPYVCDSKQMSLHDNKTYGYFFKKITVKAPITNVNITGNNWLQRSSVLTLNVTCKGSKKIEYCTYLKYGLYNVTGNETCDIYNVIYDDCTFNISHYFSKWTDRQQPYTFVIILKNDVSKVVKQATVTIYEVNKQAQPSVIVVPVAFSLVAIVLVIFGVAYYFQNRSRFIVEVADFNFGQKYTDLEYKTFKERLRDSIINAFTRAPNGGTSEERVWPQDGRQ